MMRFSYLVFFLGLLAITVSPAQSEELSLDQEFPSSHPPPVYNVSLDDSPEQRWRQIVKDHMAPLQQFIKDLDMLPIPPAFFEGVEWYAKNMFTHQDFVAEIDAIAKLSGFPFEKIFFSNFLYEFSTAKACTGILICNQAGEVLHGRNNDFDLWRLLARLVVKINFHRGGKLVYYSDVIVGGVFTSTGSVPGAFGLQVNTRHIADFSKNLISVMLMDHIPSCWLLRRVLQEETTYENAVKRLKHTSVSAPVYYIASGLEPYQGIVIEKNIDGYHAYYELSEINWFIVQTNHDRDVPDPVIDPRRTAVEARLRERGRADFTKEILFEEYMSVLPSHHFETILTAIMVPKQSYHNTTVWYKHDKQEMQAESIVGIQQNDNNLSKEE